MAAHMGQARRGGNAARFLARPAKDYRPALDLLYQM